MSAAKMKTFRHIQLLNAMLNEFHQDKLVFVITVTPIFVVAFALVTFVKSPNADIMYLATLTIIIIDGFLAILITLGQMAILHSKSHEVIKYMLCKHGSQSTRNSRRSELTFYKSCLPLRVKMGTGNFIESLTPLNCLGHSLNLSVNVLLLGGRTKV